MLSGKAAPPIASNRGLRLAHVVVVSIAILQLWWLGHVARNASARKMRLPRSRIVLRAGFLVLAILVCASWGLLIVVGIPALFGMTLVATVVRVPDFGYALLFSAALAFSTGILEGVIGVRELGRHARARHSRRS